MDGAKTQINNKFNYFRSAVDAVFIWLIRVARLQQNAPSAALVLCRIDEPPGWDIECWGLIVVDGMMAGRKITILDSQFCVGSWVMVFEGTGGG